MKLPTVRHLLRSYHSANHHIPAACCALFYARQSIMRWCWRVTYGHEAWWYRKYRLYSIISVGRQHQSLCIINDIIKSSYRLNHLDSAHKQYVFQWACQGVFDDEAYWKSSACEADTTVAEHSWRQPWRYTHFFKMPVHCSRLCKHLMYHESYHK